MRRRIRYDANRAKTILYAIRFSAVTIIKTRKSRGSRVRRVCNNFFLFLIDRFCQNKIEIRVNRNLNAMTGIFIDVFHVRLFFLDLDRSYL